MLRRVAAWLAALLLTACETHAAEPREQVVDHGQFQKLHLVSIPKSRAATVLLASGANGWDAQARSLANVLAREGALVVGVDTPAYLKKIAASSPACMLVAGDFQNLAHFAQAYLRMPSYQPALFIGLGVGASLSVAAQLQAADHNFAGTITRGFCGELTLPVPLCPGAALRLSDSPPAQHFVLARSPADSLHLLTSSSDRACPRPLDSSYERYMQPDPGDLRTLYSTLAGVAKKRAERTPEALGDLPVIEVQARAGAANHDAFAIMISGDGGWAEIDKSLSAKLAEHGVDVAGLDSLRYFWGEKSPQTTARDVARLIAYYRVRWQRDRVILLGFSQGADVLPFVWNRLPASERAAVKATVALSIGQHATFEFHVANWVATQTSGLATLPEMQHLAGHNAWCVYGAVDDSSLCPELNAQNFSRVRLPGGHHFDGHYDEVARIVMDALAHDGASP